MYWLIYPYLSGLLHWHCGNLTIAPVPAKQPWWIWVNASCEFIMNDYITTTKQSTTKPCANFSGYTVFRDMWRIMPHPDANKELAMFIGCQYLSQGKLSWDKTLHVKFRFAIQIMPISDTHVPLWMATFLCLVGKHIMASTTCFLDRYSLRKHRLCYQDSN